MPSSVLFHWGCEHCASLLKESTCHSLPLYNYFSTLTLPYIASVRPCIPVHRERLARAGDQYGKRAVQQSLKVSSSQSPKHPIGACLKKPKCKWSCGLEKSPPGAIMRGVGTAPSQTGRKLQLSSAYGRRPLGGGVFWQSDLQALTSMC